MASLALPWLISSSLIFRAVNAHLAAVLSQFAAGNTPQETSMHLLAQLNMLQWHTTTMELIRNNRRKEPVGKTILFD